MARAVALALMLAACAGLWLGADTAYGQTTGESIVVEGTIFNGTAGAGLASDLGVTLHEESPTRHAHAEVAVDKEGRFRFDGIAFSADTAYGVSVIYQG
jgi:hypothetical protein